MLNGRASPQAVPGVPGGAAEGPSAPLGSARPREAEGSFPRPPETAPGQ